MKLIKFLIKLLLFLLLLVIIIIGILLFLASDSSKSSFVPSAEPLSMEEVIGKGLDDSLTRIQGINNEQRSTSDDNYLGVSLTTEDMNNIVVDIVRNNPKLNPNYMKDGDTSGIVEQSGISLESLVFEEVEGKIAAKARVTAWGFYHSSVTLSGTPSLEGKTMLIKFENFRLGSHMSIKRDTVIGLFEKLSLSFEKSANFDVNTLTLSFDISSMIEQYTKSNRFSDFFEGCTYSMEYAQATEESIGRIMMKIDTKRIFTPLVAVGKPSDSFTLPAFNPLSPSVEINEADFNKLIQGQLSDLTYLEPVQLGSKQFTFSLKEVFYNIDSEEMQCVMAINALETNMIANVKISPVMDGDNVNELVFTVSSITLGKTNVKADNFFNEVRIPYTVLTNNVEGVKVKSFAFNKASESVTIEYGI